MEIGHQIILDNFLNVIKDKDIKHILDAGSGKTSLSAIIKYLPKAHIDAVIYPGDKRKLDSIKSIISDGNSIDIIEKDICNGFTNNEYDLVIAHLLLGEATKFGNSFKSLLNNLIQIKYKYLIIIDYLEDLIVDEEAITKIIESNKLTIIYKCYFKNDNPQRWNDFIGEHNFGYMIHKKL